MPEPDAAEDVEMPDAAKDEDAAADVAILPALRGWRTHFLRQFLPPGTTVVEDEAKDAPEAKATNDCTNEAKATNDCIGEMDAILAAVDDGTMSLTPAENRRMFVDVTQLINNGQVKIAEDEVKIPEGEPKGEDKIPEGEDGAEVKIAEDEPKGEDAEARKREDAEEPKGESGDEAEEEDVEEEEEEDMPDFD